MFFSSIKEINRLLSKGVSNVSFSSYKNKKLKVKLHKLELRKEKIGHSVYHLLHAKHFCFNWDSLHARLNSHYEAWSYKKKKHKKDYSIQEICLEKTYS